MFKVDDIPDQVLRDIAGAYHRRLASTDTESQPADERDFQRACYLRTALEWLALWLNQQPVATAAQADYWLDGDVIRKGKEYIATVADFDPLMLRELLTSKPAAQAVADDVVRDAGGTHVCFECSGEGQYWTGHPEDPVATQCDACEGTGEVSAALILGQMDNVGAGGASHRYVTGWAHALRALLTAQQQKRGV